MPLHLVREKLSSLAAPPCAFHLQGSSGLVFFRVGPEISSVSPVSRETVLKEGSCFSRPVGFRSQLLPTGFGGVSSPPRV